MSYEQPKKIVGMKLYLKMLTLANFLLFNFFLIIFIKLFVKNLSDAAERGKLLGAIIAITLIGLFLIIFAYVLPYFIIRKYEKISFYEDGFAIGKNEKILYENLEYFFIPNVMRPNTFLGIWYKDNNGTWKNITAAGYPSNAFDLFQQDFVKINYPKAMRKIENGEPVEFLFNNPKKSVMALVPKKYIAKKLEQALKIKVTREALTLDNEVYNWNDYNISTMAGRINITDKAGNKILHLSDKALIHNTNLLETIINTFGANE